MRKSFLAIVVLAITFLSAFAAGGAASATAKNVTKVFKTGTFERISFVGGIDIYYTQGNQTSVKVTAPEEKMKRVEVKTSGRKLTVRLKSNNWNFFSGNSGKVVVYVTSPDLVGVELSGSGDFKAKGHVDTDNMKIAVAGSGDIDFASLICDAISIKVAGSGDTYVKKLTTANLKVSIAGSGDVSINNANIGYANCSIAGSGTINIKGKVKKNSQSVAGSGDINIDGDD